MIKRNRNIFIFLTIIVVLGISLSLPFFIKSIVILRTIQIVILVIMCLILVIGIIKKYKTGKKVNYWQLILMVIFGLVLYLLLKNIN
jgi:hypothetical protein